MIEPLWVSIPRSCSLQQSFCWLSFRYSTLMDPPQHFSQVEVWTFEAHLFLFLFQPFFCALAALSGITVQIRTPLSAHPVMCNWASICVCVCVCVNKPAVMQDNVFIVSHCIILYYVALVLYTKVQEILGSLKIKGKTLFKNVHEEQTSKTYFKKWDT